MSKKFDAKAYYKKEYESRKAAGLCPACTNKASAESVYCEACLTKQRERQKKNAVKKAEKTVKLIMTQRDQRKKAGLCIDCGAGKDTKFRCARCFALYLEKRDDITRQESRKKAGLCCSCDNKTTTTIRCEPCKDKRKNFQRNRKTTGLCTVCGKANDRKGLSNCSACSKIKVALYAERKATGLCPHCGSDKPLGFGKHCERCRDINRKKDNRKYYRLRAQVIEAYGGVCMCCGETEEAFLQVDHVHNDGSEHRKKLFGTNKHGSSSGMYTWLRQQGFPKKGFQLLCANCNYAKAKRGQCPHQKKQNEEVPSEL